MHLNQIQQDQTRKSSTNSDDHCSYIDPSSQYKLGLLKEFGYHLRL